jgi:hypothetical protein
VTGSFSRAMIGETAFHPLNAGGKLRESSKQAEMLLARIEKILSIRGRPRGDKIKGADSTNASRKPVSVEWREFPLDMANGFKILRCCYIGHSIGPEFGA